MSRQCWPEGTTPRSPPPRLLLILTENHTMRPPLDVGDLVRFAVTAEQAGIESWHRDEYAALGVPFDRRGDLLDEQLEIWRRAWSGSPVSFDGKHYHFGDVLVEPQPYRPGGPRLWFGGSSVHPRLVRRLVRYGTGFNPLGQPDDAGLARLAAALRVAGRDPAELEYVGGTRGVFAGPDGVADLDQALAAVPAQLARGFTTICVKPSQFIDDQTEIAEFCEKLVAKVGSLDSDRSHPYDPDIKSLLPPQEGAT